MVKVNVLEAKTQRSKLIELALAGEEVVIARAGEPAVRLTPIAGPPPRIWGLDRGQVELAADFDDPLDDALARGFQSDFAPLPT